MSASCTSSSRSSSRSSSSSSTTCPELPPTRGCRRLLPPDLLLSCHHRSLGACRPDLHIPVPRCHPHLALVATPWDQVHPCLAAACPVGHQPLHQDHLVLAWGLHHGCLAPAWARLQTCLRLHRLACQVCQALAWDLRQACLALAWALHRPCLALAWGQHHTCPARAWVRHRTCQPSAIMAQRQLLDLGSCHRAKQPWPAPPLALQQEDRRGFRPPRSTPQRRSWTAHPCHGRCQRGRSKSSQPRQASLEQTKLCRRDQPAQVCKLATPWRLTSFRTSRASSACLLMRTLRTGLQPVPRGVRTFRSGSRSCTPCWRMARFGIPQHRRCFKWSRPWRPRTMAPPTRCRQSSAKWTGTRTGTGSW
mmetsp:Transcript_44420/g.128552  ORF Transcript_44420/g.128552 Transcript_44420/m.128552 type:complete len:363 (+) Transcript_44420:2494-3582(+)